MSIIALPVVLAAVAPLKIVQIDLARQMEPLPVLSNWVDRVESCGFNSIQFYVEGRIGTKTFSLPKGESYAADEFAQLVRYAAGKGMEVIPCVGMLGHAELFFKHPGNEEIDETASAKPRLGGGHNTFCISNPKTREFLKNYVAEIAAIFPGKYFNAGLDEAWNAGVCPLCRPKEEKDELFLEAVLLAHDAITAAGKRMWMWDDFFDFHPKALAKTPRDIVLCHWNYNQHVSSRGSRGHFAGLLREDLMEKYDRMGFETIPACWFRSGNSEALYSYAKRYPTMGFMITQWEEMQAVFPGGSLPRLAATGLMLNNPGVYPARDPYPDAVRRCLPSLTPAEVMAAVTVYHSDLHSLSGSEAYYLNGFPASGGPAGVETALEVLKASPLGPCSAEIPENQFSEAGILEDLVCRAESGVIADRLARLVPVFSDVRRTAVDIHAAKAELRPLVTRLEALLSRREAQAEKWRAGCPVHVAGGAEGALKLVNSLLERPEVAAADDEKRLEVVLVLPDYYGIPNWTVSGRFGKEWRELGKGAWKPGKNDWAIFSKFFTFRSETMPTELKIVHHGYGRAQLCFVSVEDSRSRMVPDKLLSAEGDVVNPERILVDDVEWADFGTCGFLEKYFDAAKAAKESSVTVSLRRE